MFDRKKIEEVLKSVAEKVIRNPENATDKLSSIFLEKMKKRILRDRINNPEKFSASGNPSEEYVRELANNWEFKICRNFPEESQVIEFLGYVWEEGTGPPAEEFLEDFFKKCIQVARDHWKQFGDFDMGTPEISEFKKHENLIKAYLFALGYLTPGALSSYMSGYTEEYEHQKAEAIRTMGESPPFFWDKFAEGFQNLSLYEAAAIFSAEIDPDVWTRRAEAIKSQKIKEGGDKGREKRTRKKEYKIETLNRYFESLQKEHPEASFKSLRDLCKEHFTGKEDHQIPEPTFFRLMKKIEKRFNNK